MGKRGCDLPPIQKEGKENVVIAGTDVEALFPSLEDLESARIAADAVMESHVKFENVNYDLALRYLFVVGGKCHLSENGLMRYAPRWLGGRPDLLTIGGEAFSEEGKWSPSRLPLPESIKKKIIAMVVETAVIVCMGTHVYTFGDKVYLQQRGGPIGMRFTASLANLVMKRWDRKWCQLLQREGIQHLMYVRYVDDCRLVLPALTKGWKWNGTGFVFTGCSDEEVGMPDAHYTTVEIAKAMCSLVTFLKFTGEDESMFPNSRLPTLDTELWVENGLIKYSFYEKPTVGNKVLNKDTALPVSSIWSSLLQETVRRLLNCSEDLDINEKQQILSKYAQKLVNSGHSVSSSKILIVQGVSKYLHKLKLSKLDEDDVQFEPLYKSKEYDEKGRQVKKFMAEMNWFKNKNKQEVMTDSRKYDWKSILPERWRGSTASQRPSPGMNFTSILKVPNTKGGALYRSLVKQEDKLARLSGYNVKIVESSGIQLVRLFPRVFKRPKCHWEDCAVCLESGDKPSLCKTRNLVYEGICLECVSETTMGVGETGDVGVYVGESSRTLSERALEHVGGAKSLDPDNFIVKHWILKHSNLDNPPRIKFKPIKSHSDALSRLVSESVWIDAKANMNSKGEWRVNKVSRLKVDERAWKEKLKESAEQDIEAKITAGIEKIRKEGRTLQQTIEAKENKNINIIKPALIKANKRSIKRAKSPPAKKVRSEGTVDLIYGHGKPSIALIPPTENGAGAQTSHGKPSIASIPPERSAGAQSSCHGKPSIARIPPVLSSAGKMGGGAAPLVASKASNEVLCHGEPSIASISPEDGSTGVKSDSYRKLSNTQVLNSELSSDGEITNGAASLSDCKKASDGVDSLGEPNSVVSPCKDVDNSHSKASSRVSGCLREIMNAESSKVHYRSKKSAPSNPLKNSNNKRKKREHQSKVQSNLIDRWVVKRSEPGGQTSNVVSDHHTYTPRCKSQKLLVREAKGLVHQSVNSVFNTKRVRGNDGLTRAHDVSSSRMEVEQVVDESYNGDALQLNEVVTDCDVLDKKKYLKDMLMPNSCYRGKMDRRNGDESENVEDASDTSPQVSGGSSGAVIGDIAPGEVIEDSDDSRTIHVGEERRDGVTDPVELVKNDHKKKKMKCKTSTPVCKTSKKSCQSDGGRMKRKQGRFIRRARKDKLKRRLIEEAQVELSSSCSDIDSSSSAKASLVETPEEGRDGSSLIEFESISSSLNEQLAFMVDSINPGSNTIQWEESSDPNIEDAIIGMADPERCYQNPFQLSEDIRNEVGRRSEASEMGVINWSLSSFDQIGGRNTLRSVWAKLKGGKRVRGAKRSLSDEEGSLGGEKKPKVSLGISQTCDELENINLCTSSSSNGTSLLGRMSLLSNESHGKPSIAGSQDVDEVERLREVSSSEEEWNAGHGEPSIAGTPGMNNDEWNVSVSLGEPSIAGISESSSLYYRVSENELSESDGPPGLASSEVDSVSVSNDSGRSDTWLSTGGIWGSVRRVTREDVETGTVTVTSPVRSVVDGFTTDGVVDSEASSGSYSSPVYLAVSSTTDEGVDSSNAGELYMDDEVWWGGVGQGAAIVVGNDNDNESSNQVDESSCESVGSNDDGVLDSQLSGGNVLSRGNVGGNVDGVLVSQLNGGNVRRRGMTFNASSTRGEFLSEMCQQDNCHGMPSIAYTLSEKCQQDNCHGMPSIAYTWCRESHSEILHHSNCHGRPSIANSTDDSDVVEETNENRSCQGIRVEPCSEIMAGGNHVSEVADNEPVSRVDSTREMHGDDEENIVLGQEEGEGGVALGVHAVDLEGQELNVNDDSY